MRKFYGIIRNAYINMEETSRFSRNYGKN
jgi:hypothetical protein